MELFTESQHVYGEESSLSPSGHIWNIIVLLYQRSAGYFKILHYYASLGS